MDYDDDGEVIISVSCDACDEVGDDTTATNGNDADATDDDSATMDGDDNDTIGTSPDEMSLIGRPSPSPSSMGLPPFDIGADDECVNARLFTYDTIRPMCPK